MTTVRLGLIGLGNIGQHHAGYLCAGKVNRAELAAVCTSQPAKAAKFGALKVFSTPEELLRSGLVDAVIIATPHYQHTTLGIAALNQGLHVMVEKPISAHKADAERLIAAHRQHPKQIFAAMFQLRTEPRYQKIRKLLESGELGKFVRMSWIMTDWFRTEAYYSSVSWRATWKGEGGGVLLNQCLHNLDAMQWLLGMPARVRGFCQLGKYHDIEVEDEVTAYLEYPNGATGTFVSSTAEAPGTNRFEITGTRGRVVLESDKLRFTRNESDMLEFSKQAKLGFVKPEVWNVEIPFENAANGHAILMQNFVNAILDGEPLIAPGEEGMHSVELANVILYSSLLEQTVELPMNAAAYESKLKELIAGSKKEKKVVAISAEDFASSFRK
jgi:predicted dehydrogenase